MPHGAGRRLPNCQDHIQVNLAWLFRRTYTGIILPGDSEEVDRIYALRYSQVHLSSTPLQPRYQKPIFTVHRVEYFYTYSTREESTTVYSRADTPTLSSTYKTGFFFTYSPLAILMIPSVGFGVLFYMEYMCTYSTSTPPVRHQLHICK